MPVTPACMDPNDKSTITFYACEKGKNHRQLWLHISCIQWLCKFAAEELYRQGVVSITYEESKSKQLRMPNDPEFPGLWISQYRYDSGSYSFQWINPDLETNPQCFGVFRTLKLNSLTQALWNEIAVAAKHSPHADYRSVPKSHRRDLALQVIKAWCRSILAGTEDEFLFDRGLPAVHNLRLGFFRRDVNSTAAAASSDGPASAATPGLQVPAIPGDDDTAVDNADVVDDVTDTDDDLMGCDSDAASSVD